MLTLLVRGKGFYFNHNKIYFSFTKSKIKENYSIHLQKASNIPVQSFFTKEEELYGDEIQEEVFDRQPILNKNSSNNYLTCEGFVKDLHLLERMQNSKRLTEAFGCFLEQKYYLSIQEQLRKFVDECGYDNIFKKNNPLEKKLFKNIKAILFEALENPQPVSQIVKLLSESDPKLIEFEEVKRMCQTKHIDEPQVSKTAKYELLLSIIQKEQNHLQNSIFTSFSMENKDPRPSNKSTKVFLKKTPEKQKFQIDEASMKKVQQKIFGNRKITDQKFILKAIPSKSKKIEKENFGENWVYCYDLPYQFTESEAEIFIKFISEKYGKITDYDFSPYRNILEQLPEVSTKYEIPQNFQEKNLKNRPKLQRKQVNKNEELAEEIRSRGKKSITTKILQKTKKEKKLALNKSSMVFKFQSLQDKKRFLSLEMRLYGLNLQKYQNIRFEEAKVKNIVCLCLNSWGSKSNNLIHLLNDALLPINVGFKMENLIMMKHHVFLEFQNFHDAFHAKNLLHDLVFQQKRVKTQLIYGSARIQNGEFTSQIQSNHHDELLSRLKEVRTFYGDLHK